MLTRDEIRHGRIFVLKLWDAEGIPSQWVESLKGELAKHWYRIYRNSDWDALRAEAGTTFRNRVSERESVSMCEQHPCVLIQTSSVRSDELAVVPAT